MDVVGNMLGKTVPKKYKCPKKGCYEEFDSDDERYEHYRLNHLRSPWSK